MADLEADVTQKEAENAKADEKEVDTKAEDKAAKTPEKSGTPAKAKREKTSSSKPAKKGGKGAAKPKAEEAQKTPEPEGGGDGTELPPKVVPLFMAGKTQELFKCVCGEDVTDENPIKLISKEDIIQDMKTRAAVSDFSPLKQAILNYDGEEIMVVFDAEFKYGENFIIALTEEAKEKLNRKFNPAAVEEGEEGGEEGEGGEGGVIEEEDTTVYRYIPPEAKEWISLGSEKEIEEEAVVETRDKLSFTVQRVRRDFGAPTKFSDRGPDDVKDGYIECTSFEDKSYNLKKVELDISVQAIPTYIDNGTQTDWKHPCHNVTQYAPRVFSEEECAKILASKELQEFVEKVEPRFDLALQQNEIMDVFLDDWQELASEDSTFGSKSDNYLKEYQSFTDLQFSKDKVLTAVEWHPTIKGVIAVSCAERMTFDDRVEHSSKIIMNPSLILLWSFTDPIHPQVLLEAPDDIFCFKFNPSDPNIITAGCINGQVVMWDISKHVDRLRSNQRGKQSKKNSMMNLRYGRGRDKPGFEDENADKTPVVRYCAVSAIEHSHKSAISDVQWVPDHMEITRMGVVCENKQQQCHQILTGSSDGYVAIWDTRPPKGQTPTIDNAKHDNPLGVATTFKHLDLTWKPVIKIPINRMEGSGDYCPTRVSLQERQGDRSVLEKQPKSELEKKDSSMGGLGISLRGGSAKEKRPLEGATTKFYVGTQEGELVYADWKLEKDTDSGRLQAPKPLFATQVHDKGIEALQRSPFFKDVLLLVGGWTFSLWKEGKEFGPLLTSSAAAKPLTAAYWSPTRPAVFYIGTAEGNVDVWDLLDKTHEPSLSQNISAAGITNIYPWVVSGKQQLLAVTDKIGTLHILEVPWTLRNPTPNELSSFTYYLDREVQRLEFQESRTNFHVDNKRKLDQEEAQKKMAPPQEPSTEEVENKQRIEFLDFKDDEKKFLEDLGLIVEEEEPLPEV
ncbi:WD repeat-containing protein 63 isoform X1 [Strongylocentrotus purpuratus]|uniref:WD repeat-containing protein 63 n=1 Tax=Strongylocentrotus purpuratus TaxID=7668 RepID=A0A7M7PJY2_STRPU|nr:WD repeat-containing protein 63 isoform X1 [Strongylocentrotus purpuratus]